MIPASTALTPEVLQAAIDYADEHTLQKPEDDYMARWRANVCARLSLSSLTPEQVAERLTPEVLNNAIRAYYRAGCLFELNAEAAAAMRAVLVEATTAGRPASAADEPRTMRPPQMGPAYDPVVEQHRDLIRPLRDGAALLPPSHLADPDPECSSCGRRLAVCECPAEPPAPPSAWQPIETAPKDGTRIIGALFDDDGRLWRVHDMKHNGLAFYTINGHSLPRMTHWMPMPPGVSAPPPVSAHPRDEEDRP